MPAQFKPIISVKQLLLVFVLLLTAASTLYAQQTAARPDRGVNPGGSYAVSDIENINMQNGNVQLRIPLASLPPIAGGKLKLTLSAIYNSKLWNITRSEQTGSMLPYRRTYRVDTPQLSDTAMVGGWSFEGGYAIFPRDARDDFNYEMPEGADPNDPYAMIEFQQLTQHNWWKMVLRTPDGAEHELRPSGGTYPTFNDPLHRRPYLWGYYRDQPNTLGVPMRYNSTDGTYLSAIVNPSNHASGIHWTIFLPDGTQIIQYTNGIQRFKDNNGNSIKIFADANGTHYQDEQTDREIKVTYNPNGGSGFGQTQVWYQVPGGDWQHIDINYGETLIQGKVYDVQDWNDNIYDENGNPGAPCRRQQLLTPQPLALPVVREIVLPVTEPGTPGRRFTFGYNSDETQTAVTPEMRWSCTVQPVSYTRTASKGLGALSQMVLPSGAKVNYTYSQTGVHDFVSMVGPGNNLLETDTIARDGVLTKVLEHDDGPDDVWTYSIPNEPNSMTSSVQNPDGSTDTQQYYPTDPNYNPIVGQTLNGLVYSTSNGVITTLRHWTAGVQQATGAIASTTFNPLVDAEYMLIVGTTRMSAKTFQHDSNGNVTQVAEYDWFDSSQVTFQGGIPTGPPNGVTPLRVTTTSYYNSPPNTNSANYYILRSLTSGTPSILNAVRETTTGPAIARFSYDGNSFDVAPTIGNLTRKSVYNNLDDNWIATSTTYDSYGNPTTATDGRGKVTTFGYLNPALGLPTSMTVDPQNGTGTQTTSTTYDTATGLVISTTDPNGNISDINYTNQLTGQSDPFARPGVTLAPLVNVNGVNQRQRVTTTYHDSTRQVITASDLYAENDKLLKTRTTVDELGRVALVEQTEDGTNYTISSRKAYNTATRMTFSSSPMRAGASSTDSWTRVTSDVLGRPIEVATFAGGTQPSTAPAHEIAGWTGNVITAYDANFTTVTDQANRVRRSKVDALGRLIRVDEPDKDSGQLGSTGGPIQPTCYQYDVLGNLTKVIQGSQIDPATGLCALSGSQQRTFTYDSLSRLRTAMNPESGTISYSYDNNGNLTQKIDPRLLSDNQTHVTTTYAYDGLNRVTSRSHNDGTAPNYTDRTPTVTYAYDTLLNGKGRLTSVSSSVSSYSYSGYDATGRVGGATQTIGSQSYSISDVLYSLAGHLLSMRYPSGRTVTNTFDNAGRLQTVAGTLGDNTSRTYASDFQYTALNGLQQEKFGTTTPIYHKLRYNARGQLYDVRVSTLSLGQDEFNWNRGCLALYYGGAAWGQSGTTNNGNVTMQQHWVPDNEAISTYSYTQQSYSYDALNRLSSVSELHGTQSTQSSNDYVQTYTYDHYGNRTINAGATWGTGINNKEFTVDTNNNRLGVPTGQSGTMSYDNAGNLTTDTYTGSAVMRIYDAENKMTKEAQAGSVDAGIYSYDGDGRRVKRKVNGVETWQVYGIGGELIAEYAANTPYSSPKKEYGYRNGELLIAAEARATGSAEPVGWMNSAGVTVTSNSLAKPSGAPTAWDAGAVSTKAIVSGDGYVEFTASEPSGYYRMCGLSHGDSGQSYADIDFALYLYSDGNAHVYEQGVYKTALGGYSSGDQFRVAVEGGVVKYRRNGVLLYTSGVTPQYPLLVDTSLYNAGATVNNVLLYGDLAASGGGAVNVALASNGATASASSSHTCCGFSLNGAINGNFTSSWGNGEGWNDATPNELPDWYQVDFAGSKTINEIDVFSLHDDYTQPNTPTETQTFSLYGLVNFEVQYWNGSAWATIPGGNVTGNNKVWRKFTFAPITTNKIRLWITSVPDAWSRLVELQAYEVASGGGGLQNVTWTNASGVAVNGNSLTKTAAIGWNSGASSTQSISSGDGYVEFTASETNTFRMLGLSNGDSNQDYTDIDFALYLGGYPNGGVVEVYEAGVGRGSFGSYTTGDVMRVAVEGGVVKYKKNGVVFYTSTVSPTYPLLVDTALYSNGATLTNVVMSGGGGGSDSSSATVKWLVTDQLGTPRMVFDQTGDLTVLDQNGNHLRGVTRHDYLPFGEEFFGGPPNQPGVGGRTTAQGYTSSDNVRQKFTAKERDIETGLDYFLARYYSSTQGRFTSPDEFKGGPDELFVLGSGDSKKQALPYAEITQPQSLNKYTYVYNNPCRYVDPDGHCGTPSGLQPGQVGICVASYISGKTVPLSFGLGAGDGRGPNGQGGTSRIEVRVAVDVSKGTVKKTDETMGTSGIVHKEAGPKGSGGVQVSEPNKDDKGNLYFQINQHGTSKSPAARLGSIDNHLNMVVTTDGKVGVTPSSTAKDYPSLEVYKYTVDAKGNVTTTLILDKKESGNIRDLGKPEKPIKADPR